jgi:hypothetical protein
MKNTMGNVTFRKIYNHARHIVILPGERESPPMRERQKNEHKAES